MVEQLRKKHYHAVQASIALADEIVSASRSSNALDSLKKNSKVEAYEQDYWSAMSNGTGESFVGMNNGLGVSNQTPYQ